MFVFLQTGKRKTIQYRKKIFKNRKKIFKNRKKIFKNAKKNFADTFTVEQQRAILHSLIKKNRVAGRRDTDILAV